VEGRRPFFFSLIFSSLRFTPGASYYLESFVTARSLEDCLIPGR